MAIAITSEPVTIDNMPKPGMLPGMEVSATATTRWPHKTFNTKISAMAGYAANATDRQMTCASLINDSFFVVGAESQFILRIAAVEALCDQPARSKEVLEAITILEERLIDCVLNHDERTALSSMLENARRKSISQSYKAKFRECGMVKQLKEFDEELYDMRSRFLHDGTGRGALDEANDKTLKIATALLKSDVERLIQ